ncbi:DUF2946 domain-containing protein [Bradyrhizobium sp. NAS80.1]|uniref:DUF2946 domain-containing protein n=1 Tax=Bradyrhizobium sp. NAS80.1 TaxID=1680159 RepID=UPI000A0794AD|nr:DUF2946 domain-containing protein [Bradyrhizobium sp. NAS80.1]
MRRRLERCLPIILLALVMQILAPIAAYWTTGIAVADPLESASICHSGTPAGAGDQDHGPYAHDGLCAICVSHAAAALDAPQPVAIVQFARQFRPVRWLDAELRPAPSRIGSNSQARAPPPLA